jgi:hypothetical protein
VQRLHQDGGEEIQHVFQGLLHCLKLADLLLNGLEENALLGSPGWTFTCYCKLTQVQNSMTSLWNGVQDSYHVSRGVWTGIVL